MNKNEIRHITVFILCLSGIIFSEDSISRTLLFGFILLNDYLTDIITLNTKEKENV
jgi:hypothetical protein